MQDAEVGVVGVGTMGSMTCWELARRGVRVLGFEQFAPGHDRGAVGGETRIFRVTDDWGDWYAEICRDALDRWRRLEQEAGRSLLTLTGVLLIGPERARSMLRALHAVQHQDISHVCLTATDLARLHPLHRGGADQVAILERDAGFLRCEPAVAAAAGMAEAHGAVIRRFDRVRSIEPLGDGVRLRADSGSYRVGRVVVADGAWAGRLLPQLGEGVQPRRHMTAWYLARDPAAAAPDRFPVFIRNDDESDLSGFPTVDGASVKVMVDFQETRVDDPDHLDRDTSESEAGAIRALVDRWLDGLEAGPARITVYQDGYSADRHPVVGVLPALPQVVVLAGFSCHGFKMAPAIGAIAADLVQHGASRLLPGAFDPARLSGIAG